jgi:hypothetical protein
LLVLLVFLYYSRYCIFSSWHFVIWLVASYLLFSYYAVCKSICKGSSQYLATCFSRFFWRQRFIRLVLDHTFPWSNSLLSIPRVLWPTNSLFTSKPLRSGTSLSSAISNFKELIEGNVAQVLSRCDPRRHHNIRILLISLSHISVIQLFGLSWWRR